jgi:hypothetical protein
MSYHKFVTSLLAISTCSLLSFADEHGCGKAPRAMRASVRHIEGQGVGYDMGYTSFDFFAATSSSWHRWTPFIDVRAHVFNNGKPAVNTGVGLRYLTSSWVYGANTYYDYRKTNHDHYNQCAIGFEALSERWDIRLNGYVPVGSTKSSYYKSRFSHFKGNYAYLSSKREFAMYGSNLEASYHIIKYKDIDIETAFGPYYFYNQNKNAVGGEVRVSAKLYDMIKLSASGSYDPVFKGIGQGELSFIVPFGQRAKPKKTQSNPCHQIFMQKRLLQEVERSEIIVVDNKRQHSIAKDPSTGAPYIFYFVNNQSNSLGTFESPYPTIQQALATAHQNDIIYVYQGSGQAYDTGTTGITLQDGQYLWGASTRQILPTTLGDISIKAQSVGLPTFTGADLNHAVITLGNQNEVSGVHINGAGALFGILAGDPQGSLNSPTPTFPSYCVLDPVICSNLLDGTYQASAVRVVAKGKNQISFNNVNATVGAYYEGIGAYSINSDILTSNIYDNMLNIAATATSANGIISLAVGSSNHIVNIDKNVINMSTSNASDLYGIFVGTINNAKVTSTVHDNQATVLASGGQAIGITHLMLSGVTQVSADIDANSIVAKSQSDDAYGVLVANLDSYSTLTTNIHSNQIDVSTSSNHLDDLSVPIFMLTADDGDVPGTGTNIYASILANIYSNQTTSTNMGIGDSMGLFTLTSNQGSHLTTNVFANTFTSYSNAGTAFAIQQQSSGPSSTVTTNILSNQILASTSTGSSTGIYLNTSTNASASMEAIATENNIMLSGGVAGGGVTSALYGISAGTDDGTTMQAQIRYNTGMISGAAPTKEDVDISGNVIGNQSPNSIMID